MSVRECGQGTPLLLLHGFTGSSEDWEHLFDLEALAQNFRVIMPDARGHGHSSAGDGRFTHRRCAADVVALLDALALPRCRALGLSLGGNTLLHLATRAPERLEAMVTISAPSYFTDTARTIMRNFSVESLSPVELAAIEARHPGGEPQLQQLFAIARGFAEDFEDMAFTPPRLATIATPTLIVTGDRDPLAPVEIFVEQRRSMPNATLCVLPGGHDVIFGASRGYVVQTVLDFFERAPAC